MNFHVSLQEAFERLKTEEHEPFSVVMKQGSMSVEIFSPIESDTQSPHRQDEIYVIIRGDAIFYRNGERISCHEGDVLFVPAGMEHRFEKFSENFATWVIFYGPESGE